MSGVSVAVISDLQVNVLKVCLELPAKTLPGEKGRDLLKQARTQLIETGRSVLENLIEKITGVKVISLHHDISTILGEEVILFTLAETPDFREVKRK